MVLRNEHAVTFYRYKMYHIFGHGHYNIFILNKTTSYLSKFLSNLLLEKLVNSQKSCYE